MLRLAHRIARVPRFLIVLLLRGYRLVISPLYGPTCRFYPSCSEYALIAVQRHGAVRGGWLAVRRLLRCNPWNPGGVDTVPLLKAASAEGSVRSGGAVEFDRPLASSAESSEGPTSSADTISAPSPYRRVA